MYKTTFPGYQKMAPRTRLTIAKADILAALAKTQKYAFSRADLEELLAENRSFWRLAQKTTVNQFVQFLQKNANLQSHIFQFPRPVVRYTLGEIGHFALIQSINQDGYYSHYTAMHFHGLTEQIPKSIYFNIEQNLRPGGGELTQAGINRSFATACRTTNNIASFREYTVYLLNGGNTDQLGVVEKVSNEGTTLRMTNLERTLIDITVRPVYSGGIAEVAKAFAEASDRVSINRLCAYLRKIAYTYPYHQSIGYYLERSGNYTKSQISQLEEFNIEFNFMLDYQMTATEYVEKWRLFIPKGF
ncbi:MAG: type IV toxin-antitoxin system AbiEi family antitoxin [Zavarzinella sp.]